SDLNLVTAVLVAVALIAPKRKQSRRAKQRVTDAKQAASKNGSGEAL
ncbi:ABC transporter permease, partial [Vibrio parahaemolyticus]|nr:ABC transporter permease [Vibrio parahaemolyticus]